MSQTVLRFARRGLYLLLTLLALSPGTVDAARPTSADYGLLRAGPRTAPDRPGVVQSPDPMGRRVASAPRPHRGNPGSPPLRFEANRGQSHPDVRFLSRGRGYVLFLTDSEAVLSLQTFGPVEREPGGLVLPGTVPSRTAVLRMRPVGARAQAPVEGLEELAGRANYFRGRDPTGWHTDVPTYARIRHRDIYPGIDWVHDVRSGSHAYDLVVAPGADPRVIRFSVEGADRAEVDAAGDLVLHTACGAVRWTKPSIYQDGPTGRRAIRGAYLLRSDEGQHEIAFDIGPYDRALPLVIDPTLLNATLIGGSSQNGTYGWDMAFGLALGTSGHSYIAGWTMAADFPTKNAVSTIASGFNGEVFVAKLTPEGADLVYATYLGTGGQDGAMGIAVDPTGHAYLTGYCQPYRWPTTAGAFQESLPSGSTAFVTKLSPAGSSIVYSTLLGSTVGGEVGNDIAVDSEGNALVVGFTSSSGFPTVNPVQANLTADLAPDAFVAKLNATGSALVYSTTLGGSAADRATAIDVDSSGRAYVTGFTLSDDFTLVGALQAAYGGGTSGDAFVARFDASGGLGYSTYLGGTDLDRGLDVAADSAGSAYVTGYTGWSGFPTTAGAFQPVNPDGGSNVFVSKISPDGSSLAYSTYLGGTGSAEEGHGIDVDDEGHAYVTGVTGSADFPVVNAAQEQRGGEWEAFVTKLAPDGSALVYSTFLGGSGSENPGNAAYYFGRARIAIDSAGRATVAGWTTSTDFPTSPDAFQRENHVGFDAFVARFGASARGPGLFLDAVHPARGGTGGPATVTIDGAGFDPVTACRLTRTGGAEIVAAAVVVGSGGDQASVVFDLRGATPGSWDLEVVNPDGAMARLAGGFEVEEVGAPELWADVVGHLAILRGVPATYSLVVGNRGNLDALAVVATLGGIPTDAVVQPLFEVLLPPVEGLESVDWNEYPPLVYESESTRAFPLLLPIVRAGQSIVVRFRIAVPTARSITLSANVTGPLLTLDAPAPMLRSAASGNAASSPFLDCSGAAPKFLSNLLGCAGALPLPPGAGCLVAGASYFMDLLCGKLIDPEKSLAVGFYNLAQAVIGLALSCGGADLAKSIWKSVYEGVSYFDSLKKCFELGAGEELNVLIAHAFDPNDKVGASGAGQGHYVERGTVLPYTVFFENKAEATAPAHRVVITDPISPWLDLATFQPGVVTFGDHTLLLEKDGSRYVGEVDLRPTQDLIVSVEARLNAGTRVLTYVFTSIDPDTGEVPEDAFRGFLPPNVFPPEGEGSIFFTLETRDDVPEETAIANQARIVFDAEDPIDTPVWVNAYDDSAPTSAVLPLAPTQSAASFLVSWSGTDAGAGIATYTVFVSTNGGPHEVWLEEVPHTAAVFPGVNGATYSFLSQARDAVGNEETGKASTEATTRVEVPRRGRGTVGLAEALSLALGMALLVAHTRRRTAA